MPKITITKGICKNCGHTKIFRNIEKIYCNKCRSKRFKIIKQTTKPKEEPWTPTQLTK